MRAGLAPAPGRVIGGFRLDRWLGGGDDTEVWRADGDGIVVALKLLRDPADVFARARMAREAAALRRIRHDHVIALFAVGEEDGEPYLATPLLDAGTLAMLLDEGRLDEPTAAAILAAVASALAAAHAAGVVHRDVKPPNVMLTSDGPVLIDFGAAALDGVDARRLDRRRACAGRDDGVRRARRVGEPGGRRVVARLDAARGADGRPTWPQRCDRDRIRVQCADRWRVVRRPVGAARQRHEVARAAARAAADRRSRRRSARRSCSTTSRRARRRGVAAETAPVALPRP